MPFRENPVGVLPQDSLSRAWLVNLHRSGPAAQVVTLDVRQKLLYVYTADKHVTAIDRLTGVVKFTMAVDSPEDRLQPLVELNGFIVFPTQTSLQVFDDQGHVPQGGRRRHPDPQHGRGREQRGDGNQPGHDGLLRGVGHRQRRPGRGVRHQPPGGVQEVGVHHPRPGRDPGRPGRLRRHRLQRRRPGREVDAVSVARLQVWATDGGYFLTSGAITADLRVDESGLYVASNDSKLYCINRATGKLKWQYFAATPLLSSPVLTADTIYQMTTNRGLVALDKAAPPVVGQAEAPPAKAYDRFPRWTYPLASQFLAQDEKFTYAAVVRPDPAHPGGPPQRLIVALDKQTGEKRFESDHKDFDCFGINPRDGLIYVSFGGGQLMALQPVLRAGQIGELVRADGPDAGRPVVAMVR